MNNDDESKPVNFTLHLWTLWNIKTSSIDTVDRITTIVDTFFPANSGKYIYDSLHRTQKWENNFYRIRKATTQERSLYVDPDDS